MAGRYALGSLQLAEKDCCAYGSVPHVRLSQRRTPFFKGKRCDGQQNTKATAGFVGANGAQTMTSMVGKDS